MPELSQRSLEMLRANHDFPGSYTFKAIGENTLAFRARTEAAVRLVLGESQALRVSTRQSAQGAHQALSISVEVDTAEDVLAVYAALKEVSGIKFLV